MLSFSDGKQITKTKTGAHDVGVQVDGDVVLRRQGVREGGAVRPVLHIHARPPDPARLQLGSGKVEEQV